MQSRSPRQAEFLKERKRVEVLPRLPYRFTTEAEKPCGPRRLLLAGSRVSPQGPVIVRFQVTSSTTFNSADWERLETALTPDSVYDEVGTGRRAEGCEGISELFQGWKQTMPDAVGTETNALASGNEVVP